jgi:hypothetical protein
MPFSWRVQRIPPETSSMAKFKSQEVLKSDEAIRYDAKKTVTDE